MPAFEPSPLDTPGGAVELVRWPGERARREHLRRAGIPCLLVLDDDQAPPDDLAIDEDWVRASADDRDVLARLDHLERRAARREVRVDLDDDGVLHTGWRTIVLTPAEATVMAALLAAAGQVVSRESLEAELWPAGTPPSDRALDAVMYRLRRHTSGLGVTIRSARRRGFFVDQRTGGGR
jgi:DNA-binding response OmpR family regulator